MDLDWRLMFVEHQSTSENKDRPHHDTVQAQNWLIFQLLNLLYKS